MDVSHKQANFGFGIDKEKVVSALRHTADRIEQGHTIVQGLSYTLQSTEDDFRKDIVQLTLVSRKE